MHTGTSTDILPFVPGLHSEVQVAAAHRQAAGQSQTAAAGQSQTAAADQSETAAAVPPDKQAAAVVHSWQQAADSIMAAVGYCRPAAAAVATAGCCRRAAAAVTTPHQHKIRPAALADHHKQASTEAELKYIKLARVTGNDIFQCSKLLSQTSNALETIYHS
jgi:hypothetical protein